MGETFFKDFVNRGAELDLLRKEAWEDKIRLLLIEGRLGIGKTNLLREFHHTSRDKQMMSVYIDLAKRPAGVPGHIYFTETIIQQLEAVGLDVEDLAKSVAEIKDELSKVENVGEQIDLDGLQRRIQEKIAATRESESTVQATKFDFHADTKISHSQLAGKIYNIFPLLLNEPQKVQDEFQDWLTLGLKNCLKPFTAQYQTVFILDHWKKENDETQSWVLNNSLYPWVINQVLENGYLVIGCDPLPDWYEGRRDFAHKHISELEAEAVRIYWVERRNLPLEMLPGELDFYGDPSYMVMTAEQVKRRLDKAGQSNQ